MVRSPPRSRWGCRTAGARRATRRRTSCTTTTGGRARRSRTPGRGRSRRRRSRRTTTTTRCPGCRARRRRTRAPSRRSCRRRARGGRRSTRRCTRAAAVAPARGAGARGRERAADLAGVPMVVDTFSTTSRFHAAQGLRDPQDLLFGGGGSARRSSDRRSTNPPGPPPVIVQQLREESASPRGDSPARERASPPARCSIRRRTWRGRGRPAAAGKPPLPAGPSVLKRARHRRRCSRRAPGGTNPSRSRRRGVT